MISTSKQPQIEALGNRLGAMGDVQGRSLWADARKRFAQNRAAMVCVYILFAIVLFALFGGYLSAWSNEEIDWGVLGNVLEQGHPSIATGHYFGTDELGRDLYARVVQGSQISIAVGIVGALVTVFIGTLYGAVSGFVGGRTDSIMMRIVDILNAVPFFFVLILMLVVLGRSIIIIFIGIGLFNWMGVARIVRGQTLNLKNREFIEAARATGVPAWRIIVRHIIPNLMGVIVVYCSLLVPDMILVESVISFLGVGVQEPSTSWGVLISEGTGTLQYGTYWQLGFPLFFFTLSMFCFFFIGDGLRDALDPKDR